ncbi:MAG: hypothetical protein ACLGIF_11395 [Actinomycetes bacterium]
MEDRRAVGLRRVRRWTVFCLAVAAAGAGCNAGQPPAPSPSPAPSSATATPGSPSPATPRPTPSPTKDEPTVIEMPADQGSTIEVPGTDGRGAVSTATPVAVTLRETTCEDEFDDIGQDTDGRVIDVKAGKGEKLCLMTFAVRNPGQKAIRWSANPTASMVGSDGEEYFLSDKRWSPGQVATQEGTPYSGDGDLIAPGRTEYDYALFELPQDVEPVQLHFLDES